MSNLLIGAVSTNYKVSDVENWVRTSQWDDCERVLFIYKSDGYDNQLLDFLNQYNVTVVEPDFDFWGNQKESFVHNTGICNIENSYELIHNIRFLHIWTYLMQNVYRKVLITDVRDVYFNRNPFPNMPDDRLIAASEMVLYKNHHWNMQHLSHTLGVVGVELMMDKPVYNVGVFGGGYEITKQICSDIYLVAVGKSKVADQTGFNYLLNTSYKDRVDIKTLDDRFAVHLHVINEGHVTFDLNTINEYDIVHQYDRLPNWSING